MQRVPFFIISMATGGHSSFFRALCILLTGYIWATFSGIIFHSFQIFLRGHKIDFYPVPFTLYCKAQRRSFIIPTASPLHP